MCTHLIPIVKTSEKSSTMPSSKVTSFVDSRKTRTSKKHLTPSMLHSFNPIKSLGFIYFLPSLMFLLVIQFEGVTSIKLTNINVPDIVYRGESFWINCTYDMEGQPLYSVKWFKKNNEVREEGVWSEFYRYIPNDDEVKKSYPMKGVKVDLDKSSHGNVYLLNSELDTEGTYKCEVSADAPSFETVREEKDTRIYYFTQNQPTIKGLRTHYGIGEYVEATCNINFGKPHFKHMTSLNWYINGEPIPLSYMSRATRRRMKQIIQGYPGSFQSSDSLDDSDSDLQYTSYDGESMTRSFPIKFLVNPTHFVNGAMKLKCLASTIPEMYSRSQEEVILPEPARGASPGRYSSDSQRLSLTNPAKLFSFLLLGLFILSLVAM